MQVKLRPADVGVQPPMMSPRPHQHPPASGEQGKPGPRALSEGAGGRSDGDTKPRGLGGVKLQEAWAVAPRGPCPGS